jgi:hypothetical protein
MSRRRITPVRYALRIIRVILLLRVSCCVLGIGIPPACRDEEVNDAGRRLQKSRLCTVVVRRTVKRSKVDLVVPDIIFRIIMSRSEHEQYRIR